MSTRSIARWGVLALLMSVGLAVAPAPAGAAPTADFRYVETDLGGGTFRYDYTLFNLSDPVADAGADAFDVLVFDLGVTFSILGLPADWDGTAGPDFALAFSSLPGAPPGGADVPPGNSLTGFAFTTDAQVGDIPFEVSFTNPAGGDPIVFTGITSPLDGNGAPVPEPASVLLLVLGLAGIAGYAARR